MIRLSAVIIVHNEEHDITACLTSIAPAVDEIIIVDSFSTDRTVEKCTSFTGKIYQHKFKGFGEQKQFAVNRAAYDWILQIDADERLTAGLAHEIREWKKSDKSVHAGYQIPFHFYFMGKRMRFGRSRHESHIRLFKKSASEYGAKKIHEGIQINGSIGMLVHPIEHYSYKDLKEYFEKSDNYTSLIAQEKYAKGNRFHVWHVLRFPLEFVIRYIGRLGFLDGMPGFIYALISSHYALMKYIKLRKIEQENKGG
ncbi:MAG: glycosyltransferase family 2 protein [bacterium]